MRRDKIKCHYLNTLKSKTIPTHLLFFDTESYIIESREGHELPFRMGWSCFLNQTNRHKNNNEEWRYFDNKKKLCEYIISKTYEKTCLYVFAHNIFHDLRVIDFFTFAQKEKWCVQKLIDKGTTSLLKVRKDKKTIVFLSTTNFFNFSLDKLGESIGEKKGQVDFKKDDDDTISKYCKQDVNIIKEIILRLFDYIRENDLGGFSITAASQSMKTFRYKYMTKKIFPVDDEEVIQLERESYHGGRTECFHIGDLSQKNIKVYDINSMYPFVMKSYYYPTYCSAVYDSCDVKTLEKLLDEYCIIANVQVKTNDPAYVCYYNKRTVFPVGTFNTVLTTPEIEYGLKKGHIQKVEKIILYFKNKIFRNYVDFFYTDRMKHKENGNAPYVTLTKLFLNSLYGKFGQEGYDQSTNIDYTIEGYSRIREIDLETGKVYWKTRILNTEIIDEDGDKPGHTFVAIASHVTAYARIYLWKLINICGRDHVFYCDTDSVFVDGIGEKNILKYCDEKKLGYLKLEKEPSNIRIYGLKDYVLDGKMKSKGIRKSATNLSIDEMKRYLNVEKISKEEYEKLKPIIWKQQQFSSLKTSISEKNIDKVEVKYVIKRLRRVYKKGKVLQSGKVIPFKLFFP